MASERTEDVLEYLRWWDYMLWREQHRLDPTVEWAPDLSWNECAAIAGVEWGEGAGIAPGDRPMNVDVAVELYWPDEPPWPRRRSASGRTLTRLTRISS